MTRDCSPIPEAIIIGNMETPPSQDHATLINTLKELQDNEFKPAMEEQFAVLQNMINLRMENIMYQTMQILARIQTEVMYRIADKLKLDNARLQRQVEDLKR